MMPRELVLLNSVREREQTVPAVIREQAFLHVPPDEQMKSLSLQQLSTNNWNRMMEQRC